MKPSSLKELKEEYEKKFPIEHYYCDDCWYSCPKAEDGCCDEAKGDECTCGAEEKHKEVWSFILKSYKLGKKEEREKILDEWESAIFYSRDTKSCLDKKVMENLYKLAKKSKA